MSDCIIKMDDRKGCVYAMQDHLRTMKREVWKARYTYLFLLPGFAFYFIFKYIPMYGLLMAFEDYSARLGVLGSKWVGFKHFKRSMRLTMSEVLRLRAIVFNFPLRHFVQSVGWRAFRRNTGIPRKNRTDISNADDGSDMCGIPA